jgi:selenocysteine-specific elongation factor
MIVATAGHIDHGKTALVKALTGIDADRLPEEKVRGITLDLGFAYAPAGGVLATPLGFVDVPGHERLVRTMVAGATGVACALLAVAADDGIMPQTREHVAILDLLGLDRGVVAITKCDRADPARVAAVAAETRQLIAGTSLGDAPVVPCSALTGVGIADLARALEAAAAATVPDPGARGFRLAVDRRFTVPGAGLVVTGAIHAGAVRVGDRLLVSPGGQEARVRAVRVRDGEAEGARAGDRCALNLTGPRLGREAVARGHWILDPALAGPTTRLDVSLRLLSGEPRPLRHRTPVQVHLGAAAVTGRVLLQPDTMLTPGDTTAAVIALDSALGALAGDRFVVRDVSATRTLGGGRVIDIDGPRRGAWSPERRGVLSALAEHDDRRALERLLTVASSGVDIAVFGRLRNVRRATLDGWLADLGAVSAQGTDRPTAFAAARIAALSARILAELDRIHRDEPDSPGSAADELAASLPATDRPALPAALEALLRSGGIGRRHRVFHRPGHIARLHPADAAVYVAVRTELEAAGLDQPRLALLAERLGKDPEALRAILEKVGRIGWLRRLSKNYFVLPAVLSALARIAEDVAAAHPEGLVTVGRFREAAGIGRNMTMPVLEFFDVSGFTVRLAEGRRIRTDWRMSPAAEAFMPAAQAVATAESGHGTPLSGVPEDPAGPGTPSLRSRVLPGPRSPA